MPIHDISLKLAPDTVRWVTSPPFELHGRRRMSRGEPGNSSAVNMSVHAGTHVDAPFHYVPDGKTIEQLPPELFVGPAMVVEVDTPGRYVMREHVETIDLGQTTRVLFKTRNSALLKLPEYTPDFVALSVEAAALLAERGATVVGLDYLSVAHADEQVPVHRALLDREVIPLEGIDLSGVAPGLYELICLPICLSGSDGAPCRAVLRREL